MAREGVTAGSGPADRRPACNCDCAIADALGVVNPIAQAQLRRACPLGSLAVDQGFDIPQGACPAIEALLAGRPDEDKPTQQAAPSATAGSIGAWVRRARLARGMTQGDLAGDSLSVSYVSGVEHGKIRPSSGMLERLAERLRFPVGYLLLPVETGAEGPDQPLQSDEENE